MYSLFFFQDWRYVAASDMNYFYNVVISEDERSRVESVEPFDEYEEWHLKCAHYMLLTAFTGSCLTLASLMWPAISSHSGEITDDLLNSKSLRIIDAVCGTFLAASAQLHHLSASSNTELLSCNNSCDLKELTGSVGTELINSKIEPNQSQKSHETVNRILPFDVAVSSHWKVAKLTYIGEETDTKCQRFGHTASILSVNGHCHMVVIGGFGVASCGRHRRLSNIAVWDLPMLTSQTFSIDSDLLSRMCHAAVMLGNSTCCNSTLENSSLVVVGGRRSPASPVHDHVVAVKFSDTSVECQAVVCSGDVPAPCWRHTVVLAVIGGMSNVRLFQLTTIAFVMLSILELVRLLYFCTDVKALQTSDVIEFSKSLSRV